MNEPLYKPGKKEQILETAGKLFMTRGFQSVSMDQIAAAVPVSKPTLYAHFEDKRALFAAVIRGRCDIFLSLLRAGIENHDTPEKALFSFAREFLNILFSEQSLQFSRTMIGESTAFPEMAKLFYETGPASTYRLLTDYLRSLHERKILNIEDPELSADVFIGMLRGYSYFKCLMGLRKSPAPKERERLARHAVQVFINGHRF